MSELLTPQEALQALQDGKKVECLIEGLGTWHNVLIFSTGALANANNKFRLVQEMITVGDVSFPKPETKALKEGQGYFMPDPHTAKLYFWSQWDNDKSDEQRLKRGVVHLTEENAIAHAKALIKLSGGQINDN